jgi:flagellar motor protein MotB
VNRILRRAGLVLCSAIAGCTSLSSTLPATKPAVSFVGVPGPAVAGAALDAELDRVQSDLQQRLTGREWSVPLQLARTAEDAIRIRLAADPSFEAGSAELAPGALLLYAEIGEVLKAEPALVTHVLVHGATPALELPSDLTARRAASVQSYLVSRGIPATRVRAEGRAEGEPVTPETGAGAINRRVELVLKPVVEGREAQAWVAPLSTRCTSCEP